MDYKDELKAFDEIRPYEPEEMKQAFNDLLNDRQFNLIMKGFAPWLPKFVRNGLLRLAFIGVKSPLDFQLRFMKPVVKYIIRKHTDGCTFDNTKLECRTESVEFATATDGSADSTAVANSTLYTLHSKLNDRFTFVSNHRDIVLDSAFLDLKLKPSGCTARRSAALRRGSSETTRTRRKWKMTSTRRPGRRFRRPSRNP